MIDESLIHKGIRDSGFPFELRVAAALIDLGYEVKPSYFFFDRDREKDAELDLIASKQFEYYTEGGTKIATTCRIVIECKDTANPLICFGLPVRAKVHDDLVGVEMFTSHFRTSRDQNIKGRFNVILTHPRGSESPRIIAHHHYAGLARYHGLALAELRGGGNQQSCKISSPDTIRHPLSKLGSFIGLTDATNHEVADRDLEEMAGGPYLNVLFAALVHPGGHHRYLLAGDTLKTEHHTPLFLTRSYAGSPLYFVVDLISFEALSEAVATIEASLSALVNRVVPYMLASELK